MNLVTQESIKEHCKQKSDDKEYQAQLQQAYLESAKEEEQRKQDEKAKEIDLVINAADPEDINQDKEFADIRQAMRQSTKDEDQRKRKQDAKDKEFADKIQKVILKSAKDEEK